MPRREERWLSPSRQTPLMMPRKLYDDMLNALRYDVLRPGPDTASPCVHAEHRQLSQSC